MALHLGATKTDIRGRGARRAHMCICHKSDLWKSLCPSCALAKQLARRRAQGAWSDDPLFPGIDGKSNTVKRATVEAMRAVYSPLGRGQIDGHSMRRSGAQYMAAAGIPVEMVMWFGRWGSSAIRAYIEDARTHAPGSSDIALEVASSSPARDSGRPTETQVQCESLRAVERLERVVADLQKEIREANAFPSAEECPPQMRWIQYSLGKTHIAKAEVVSGTPAGRVAMCGWRFGSVSSRALVITETEPRQRACVCRSCRRAWMALVGGSAGETEEVEEHSSSSSGGSSSS